MFKARAPSVDNKDNAENFQKFNLLENTISEIVFSINSSVYIFNVKSIFM